MAASFRTTNGLDSSQLRGSFVPQYAPTRVTDLGPMTRSTPPPSYGNSWYHPGASYGSLPPPPVFTPGSNPPSYSRVQNDAPNFSPFTRTNILSERYFAECPFAWKAEVFRAPPARPEAQPKAPNSLSFTATRVSKVWGYIFGPFVGIRRIMNAYQEYIQLKSMPRSASNRHVIAGENVRVAMQRSLQWMARGALESIPILGALTCIVIDIAATLLYQRPPAHEDLRPL